jgi:hypothetical protein
MILFMFVSLSVVMSAGTAACIGGRLLGLQGRAGLAQSVQNGAAAVHTKSVVSRNVRKQLLADGAFQMNEIAAGDAFEVEMMRAVSLPYVLVDVSGLGIAAVLAHSPVFA